MSCDQGHIEVWKKSYDLEMQMKTNKHQMIVLPYLALAHMTSRPQLAILDNITWHDMVCLHHQQAKFYHI